MDSASAVSARLIGSLVVEKGLITEEQLEQALDNQQTTGRLLGEILVDLFGITREALEGVLGVQQTQDDSAYGAQQAAVRELARMLEKWGRDDPLKRPIGEIFLERGFITTSQLEAALTEQKLTGRKLGEILVSRGDLSRLRLWDALEDQAAAGAPADAGNGNPAGAAVGLRVAPGALAGDALQRHEIAAAATESPTTPVAPPPAEDISPEPPFVPPTETPAPPVAVEPPPVETEWTPNKRAGGEEWRDALATLSRRIETAVSGVASVATVNALSQRLDALDAPTSAVDVNVEGLERRLDELAASLADKAAREDADGLRNDLDQLKATVSTLPAAEGVEGLEQQLEQLTSDVAEKSLQHTEDLRRDLAELRAVVDALPNPADSLSELAGRLDVLAEKISTSSEAPQTDALKTEIEQLRTTVESLPSFGGDVTELAGRLDQLAQAVAEATTREETEALRNEINRLREDAGVGLEDSIGELVRRVDHLSAAVDGSERDVSADLRRELDELRGGLADAANAADDVARLGTRIDELVGALTATASRQDVEELRRSLDELHTAFGSLASSGADVDRLRHGLDELTQTVAVAASRQEAQSLRDDVDGLRVRIESLPSATDEIEQLGARLTDVAAALSDTTRERTDQLQQELHQLRDAVGSLSARGDDVGDLRMRVERVSEALGSRLDTIAQAVATAVSPDTVERLQSELDEVRGSVGLHARHEQVDEIGRRVEELARRVNSAATTEETDALRGDAAALVETMATLAPTETVDALAARVDELARRLAASPTTAETDALRREATGLLETVSTLAPSETVDALSSRVDELAESLTRRASRKQAEQLREDIDALGRLVDALPSPTEAVEELAVRVEELARRVAASASTAETDALRREATGLIETIATLAPTETVDALATRVDELARRVAASSTTAETDALRREATGLLETVATLAPSETVDALSSRVDELAESLARRASRKQTEQLRQDIDALARAVEALPSPTEAVGELSDRLNQLANTVASAATRANVDGLRSDLESLRSTVEALPVPSEEWRDLLVEVGARIDELVSGNGVVSSTLEGLTGRLDIVDEAAVRHVEQFEELDAKIRRVRENLQAAAASTADQSKALRSDLDLLRADLEAIPAPSEEWRELIAQLGAQLDKTRTDASGWPAAVAAVATDLDNARARLDEAFTAANAWPQAVEALSTRIDELPPPSEEWRDRIAELSNRLREGLKRLQNELAGAASTESVVNVAMRLDEVGDRIELARALLIEHATTQERLGTRLDEHDDQHEQITTQLTEHAEQHQNVVGRVDELFQSNERTVQRLDQLGRRADGLAPLRRVEELLNGATVERQAETALLQARLDRLEETLGAAQARIEALEPLEARLAAVEPVHERLDALETRLTELTARERAHRRTDLDGMRDELAAAINAQQEAAGEERERTQGLSQRVDDLEDAAAQALTWPKAVEPLQAQLRELEGRFAGFTESEPAERRRELVNVQAELAQRLERLASTSAARTELDAVRDRLEEEITRMLERQDQDDAASRAAGEAIRDGLADLARRVTASHDEYVESGRNLRRSIEGLGAALTDADAQLSPGAEVADEGAEEQPANHSGYVAFVPAAGGDYEIVELDGSAPYLGQVIEVPGFEGATLRVSRLGRSPLPFDGRPCVYLEQLSS